MNKTIERVSDEISCRASNATQTVIAFKAVDSFRIVQFHQWNTSGTASIPYMLLEEIAGNNDLIKEAAQLVVINIEQSRDREEVAAR